MFRELNRDFTNDVETVSAGTKCQGRFEFRNAFRELAAFGNIGRIRGNNIELHIAERLKEVADADVGA